MHPSVQLALLAARTHRWLIFSLPSTKTSSFTADSLNTQHLPREELLTPPLQSAVSQAGAQGGQQEQYRAPKASAAIQCSCDRNGDTAAQQGAGHGPKGMERSSLEGAWDRLIMTMLQFQEARSLLLTALCAPPLVTLSSANTTHKRIKKNPPFFTLL